ncbi:MAG: hypothetical protein IKQ16_09280 [Lentisphaeria bacterium]|nr:hypothetical protein [Lentisphaeria bacterium]
MQGTKDGTRLENARTEWYSRASSAGSRGQGLVPGAFDIIPPERFLQMIFRYGRRRLNAGTLKSPLLFFFKKNRIKTDPELINDHEDQGEESDIRKIVFEQKISKRGKTDNGKNVFHVRLLTWFGIIQPGKT